MDFLDKLLSASENNQSLLCIGLDPDPERIPAADVLAFNIEIIDATSDLVCAYKPNLAFYEALGTTGLKALERTVKVRWKDLDLSACLRDLSRTGKVKITLDAGLPGSVGETLVSYSAEDVPLRNVLTKGCHPLPPASNGRLGQLAMSAASGYAARRWRTQGPGALPGAAWRYRHPTGCA